MALTIESIVFRANTRKNRYSRGYRSIVQLFMVGWRMRGTDSLILESLYLSLQTKRQIFVDQSFSIQPKIRFKNQGVYLH